jgi:hypothetical protein
MNDPAAICSKTRIMEIINYIKIKDMIPIISVTRVKIYSNSLIGCIT